MAELYGDPQQPNVKKRPPGMPDTDPYALGPTSTSRDTTGPAPPVFDPLANTTTSKDLPTPSTAPPAVADPAPSGAQAAPIPAGMPSGTGQSQASLNAPAATTIAPPAPPAAPGLPPGWADAGNGLVRNAETGQMLPTNHPLWAAILAQQPQGPAAPPALPAAPPVAPPVTPQTPPGAPPGVTGDPIGPLTGSTVGTPEAPPPPDPQTTAYKDALMKMLGQAQTLASLEDPALKAQSDAAALGLTRATEAGRSALAERMAQTGGPGVNSGAFNSELAGLFNRQGEQQAAINAGLVGDANAQKVQQLQAALTMMGNDVNSAEGRALTRELSKAQMAQAAHEFEANFGLEGRRLGEQIRQFDISTEAGKAALAQQLQMFKEQMAQQGKQFDVDAALKKMGIESQAGLGGRELDIRDKLGTGGLNAEIARMLMQNDQFGKNLGANLGMFNSSQNTNFLSALLSQLGA